MRLSLSTFVATVATFIALQGVAHAHFIWATVQGNQVRFALLENIAEAPNVQFAKYVEGLSAHSGTGKFLTLGAPKNGARYATLPPGESIGTVDSVIGVKDREGEVYLLTYHAKGVASLAAAGTDTKDSEEILARREGNQLRISVQQEGWRVPFAEVWLQWPGETNPSSLKTNIAGEVQVPWPTTLPEGFVGVRTLLTEDKTGTNDGKKYSAIHHWTTLTFPIGATTTEKSFTQILRDSFGKNHEIVGAAAFNKTLFDDKLTKEQLITHLQQRALIHNELHRILIGAGPGKTVPYGTAQKNVLIFLFEDLIAMGSGWPTETQARPLTKAFLQEIRDSEKRGPYFALGVQHVYYGGITNGGRMTGQKINETLKIPLSYYEKSDGYPEYLAEVNKITDPQARQEMLRGGQAAYQYIIASSNEDVFQAK